MRILVAGHAATVAANQSPYAALLDEGTDVHLVVPARWHHELEAEPRAAEVDPALEGRVHLARIARPGSIQAHLYLDPPRRWLRQVQPDVVLVDAEPFSVPAAQWVRAGRRHGVPVAVSAWENLDRPLPWVARALRSHTLPRASGVCARTPTAAGRAVAGGARGPVVLVPPAVEVASARTAPPQDRPFTVGYAGRLVEAKGIRDLLAAVDLLPDDTRLLVAGDGPLVGLVRANRKVDLRLGLRHGDMPALYAEMDVLVLPSRTTPTWSEQLGRVLLEAMAVGTPVIGADSGEIPWVLSEARGGTTFPEGDVGALAGLLMDVRTDPSRWRATGARGRADVAERFSPRASADALLDLARRLVDGGAQ